METSHTRKNKDHSYRCKTFGQGGYSFGNYKVVNLCLGLLNVALLVIAVVLGMKCAKVKTDSLQVTHSAALQLINELTNLRGNHSDVIEAEEEAKRALGRAKTNHTLMKEQIEQLKATERNQTQIDILLQEKTNLQANISALGQAEIENCGRCPSGWNLFNTSCYFFSYSESPGTKKTWSNSQADCVSRGSDLVVIDNQQEQTFVSSNIEKMKTSRNIWDNGFWIGLHDQENEGTFVWINNVTEVEKRYWMNLEPNNLGSEEGEDCVLTVYARSNPWKTRFDTFCDSFNGWICEMLSK